MAKLHQLVPSSRSWLVGDREDYVLVCMVPPQDALKLDLTVWNFAPNGAVPAMGEVEVLQLCKHRTALFNNKTKNAKKRASQINELIILVDKIFTENGGKPYTNELFLSLQEETKRQRKMKEEAELQALAKKETARLQEQMQKAYDAQLARVTETIESKLSGTISSLERELAETRQAHQNAVSHSHMAHQQAMNEIHALQHNLSAAHQEIERLRRPPPRPHRLCAIM
uniref:AIG1-type G domain-containing protein n=1 Tax=Nelumbo nucifera TaxID=4432 RepID=A0A822YDT0_NELNU|nr:TPA_asm: hypothetical protein HUJ06_029106 [Nelumbo nucifera]